MTSRILTICINVLLCAFGLIALLSVYAEVERREDVELQRMLVQHKADELNRAYGELDERGREMTGFDLIAKGR